MLVLSVVLIMGNQIPDAFGVKPTSVTVIYNGGGGTLHVEDKNGATSFTDPCGGVAPCAADFAVADGDVITVFSDTGAGSLESETRFFIDGSEFFFNNKPKQGEPPKPPLHTSCSAPQLIGVVGTVPFPPGMPVTDTITVLSQVGGSGADCTTPPDIVGGHGGPIDKTALMVTGAQLSASWMIPVLISAVGIGVFVITYKKE